MPYTVKRFRFRLQTLLNIEQNKEKQAQIAFSRAVQELRRQEETLARQEAEYRREQGAMAEAIRSGRSPRHLASYDALFQALKHRMQEQQQRIAQAKEAAEAARQELAERTRQRKILEKLKENAVAEYKEEVRHVEIATLDEVGNSMAIRNRE